MLELWLICFDAMPGALGLTRTQSALLHACCLPLVLFLDVNKIILPDMNMFVFRLWRSWMSWNEFIAFVLTYNGCPCWETLSRPPTGIWPRFHAIDYIDQVSSQSSAVNRRATPLVSAGHGIYGMSSFFFWKSRQAWPNQPVTEHVWYATNSKRLSCPKKTFLRKNELMREISLQQSFQISLPRVMPQPAPAPRMWTAWTRFVEKVGQSALGSADASDVSI